MSNKNLHPPWPKGKSGNPAGRTTEKRIHEDIDILLKESESLIVFANRKAGIAFREKLRLLMVNHRRQCLHRAGTAKMAKNKDCDI